MKTSKRTPDRSDINYGDLRCWWTESTGEWHYDGPASCGPPEVRKSGRGPYWRGVVSQQFVTDLRRRVKRAKKSNE